jgi:zinc transport system permease protein
MFSFLDYDFMQRALLGGFGVAIICPLIGSALLMRKSVMQADVLSHSALTGVALGIWL